MKKRNVRKWWIIKHLLKKKEVICTIGWNCKAKNEKHFKKQKHLKFL